MNYGIAVLAVIALAHFYAALTYKPDYAAIHELTADRNFEKVRVLGKVNSVSILREAYSNATVKFELISDEAAHLPLSERTITVKLEGEPAGDYLRGDRQLNKGDLVEVAASLFAGEEYRHLSINGVQFIRVLERSSETNAAAPVATPESYALPEVTINQLLTQAENFRDQSVRIPLAEIVSVPEGLPFFRACDPGNTNQTLIIFGFEGTPLAAGQKVAIRGQFVYYEKKGYWEIMTRRGDRRAVTVLPSTGSDK